MSSTHHSRVGARSHAKLKKWSDKVARKNDAIVLEDGFFKKHSAHDVAVSVKRTIATAKVEVRSLLSKKR
jgi:Protein of unknown function (DUF3175)